MSIFDELDGTLPRRSIFDEIDGVTAGAKAAMPGADSVGVEQRRGLADFRKSEDRAALALDPDREREVQGLRYDQRQRAFLSDPEAVAKQQQGDAVYRGVIGAIPSVGLGGPILAAGARAAAPAINTAKDVAALTAAAGPMAGARVAAPYIAGPAGVAIAEGLVMGEKAPPTTNAAMMSMGPQSGQTSIPGDIVDKARAAYKNLSPFPGLGKTKMPLDPSQTAEEALVLARAKLAGAGDTAAERAVSLRGNEAYDKAFNEFLDYADLYQTALDQHRKGKAISITGGISGPEAARRARAAAQQLNATPAGAAYFQEKLAGTNKYRDEILDMARGSGQMDPNATGKIDYIPHIRENRLQDEFTPGLLADTDAQKVIDAELAKNSPLTTGGIRPGPFTGPRGSPHTPKPGVRQMGEKAREGGTSPMAGDALSRLAVKGAAVERRAIMNKFVEDLKPLTLTDDIRMGKVKFDPALHKLYDFGGGKYEVLPKELAEAVSAAGSVREDLGQILGMVASLNNAMHAGLLKYNPAFHVKQKADDFLGQFMNIPWGRKIEFLKGWHEHGKKLKAGFEKIAKGQYSEEIAQYRREGLLTDVFESLIETQGDIRKLSEKTLKPEKGLGAMIDRSSLVRETRGKAAMADIYKAEGATADRAAYVANKWTGDYISKSKTGREVGIIAPLAKWAWSAAKRLTIGSLEDPVKTGGVNNYLRGAAHSPLKELIPIGMAASLWNYVATGGKDKSFDGFIVGDQKYAIPGYGSMLASDKSLPAIAPAFRTLQERLGGKPKRAVPTEGVSDETQGFVQAKQGGLGLDNPLVSKMLEPLLGKGRHNFNLSPQTQADLEKFFSAAGAFRRATSADSEKRGGIKEIARWLSPVRISDVKDQRRREFFANRDSMLEQAASLLEQKKPSEVRAVLKRWTEGGGDPKDFFAELKAGKRRTVEYEKLTREQREKLRLAR